MRKNNKAIVGNAADPKQVKRAKSEEEFLRDQELNDIRTIMSTKEGRRYMLGLLKRCNIYRNSFTGNSTTFYNEGMRNIGLKVLGDINEGSLDLYNTMMQEAQEEGVKL